MKEEPVSPQSELVLSPVNNSLSARPTARLALRGLAALEQADGKLRQNDTPGMERANAGRTADYQTKGVHSNPKIVWRYDLNGTPQSSPSVHMGIVYVNASSRTHAIDLLDGTRRWIQKTWAGRYTSPGIFHGIVAVQDKLGYLQGLEAATGDIAWKVQIFDAGFKLSPIIVGETIYSCGNLGVWEIGLRSGTRHMICQNPHLLNTSPAVESDVAYLLELTIEGYHQYAVDLSSRKQIWRKRVGNKAEDVRGTVVGNGIVVGVTTRAAFALDATDGTEKWVRRTGTISVPSTPAMGMEKVFLQFFDGVPYLLTLDATSGKIIWIHEDQDGSKKYSDPVLADGAVYMYGNKYLYALEGASGNLLWKMHLPSTAVGTPVIAEGHILVNCKDGCLYAISEDTA